MKTEDYTTELIKSIEQAEFTKEMEIATIGTISKFFEKYPYKDQKWYKPDHEFIIKQSALETCKRLALNFNPERSNNAFAYMVQIIKSDFAKTYLQLVKEYQNGIN